MNNKQVEHYKNKLAYEMDSWDLSELRMLFMSWKFLLSFLENRKV
jgi:hypothetical protein